MWPNLANYWQQKTSSLLCKSPLSGLGVLPRPHTDSFLVASELQIRLGDWHVELDSLVRQSCSATLHHSESSMFLVKSDLYIEMLHIHKRFLVRFQNTMAGFTLNQKRQRESSGSASCYVWYLFIVWVLG